MTRNELARLLNLYPITVLRATWNLGNLNKDAAIAEVVKQATESDIVGFAAKYHPCNRQHVHLFDLPSPIGSGFPSNPIGGNIAPQIKSTSGASREYFFLADLKFGVVILDTPRREYIEFKWPISVIAEGSVLQVKFTIMEKDLSSYFDNSPVSVRSRNIDESTILTSVKATLAPSWSPSPMDINRGVKALWEKDIVDSPAAQWKNAKSTTVEIMDETFMIKRDRQDVYKIIAKSPLQKTQFSIRDDKSPISRFVVDAGSGVVRFPKFSTSPKGTTDVIAQILKFN